MKSSGRDSECGLNTRLLCLMLRISLDKSSTFTVYFNRLLGPRDRLVTWNKPTHKPANLSALEWEQLPATLTVRMVRVRLRTSNSRCRTITLVTTLTNPKLWPVKLLAALYHR